jgi:chloramphenicol 3-O phosphotransferase
MQGGVPAGQIVILNGAPRSGKSAIADAIQASFEGIWMSLGVDVHVRHVTPPPYRPGIGLRPGGERPNLERVVPRLYAALYESVAAHSRLGLNVVVDVGHHDSYSVPLGILPDCARRLAGLPVLFVGVRCPIDVIMERRRRGEAGRGGLYATSAAGAPVPPAVLRWQREVHVPGLYDLELDTSELTPAQCAEVIAERLRAGTPVPSAFDRLARAD